MKISLKWRLIGLIAIVMVIVGCVMARQHQINHRLYFLSFHCDSINDDITRPDHRQCVRGLTLDSDIFTFETRGGIKEQYLIIATNGNADDIEYNSFVYNFMQYIEE